MFNTNSNQQPNDFQFGISKPEAINGLSNMMSKFDFNVSSSSTIEMIYPLKFFYSRHKIING